MKPIPTGQKPVRMLDKPDVLEIVPVSFPTIWTWMIAGKFPRSYAIGSKSFWRSDEIEAWLSALKHRRLKGDAPDEGDAPSEGASA
jgi:predicted DNA-binding transcriptional regulator AlpA